METNRRHSRRSFLARVVAGGALAGGALGTVAGEAAAQARPRPRQALTDRDRGATADPPGRGRGPPPAANGKVRSGLTDADPADPAGNGLGSLRPHGACVDRDPHDPGGGRGPVCGTYRKPDAGTGLTDNDPGDPALNGRRRPRR